MIGSWKAFLQEKAGEWELPQSGQWNVLFHNNYQPHYSNLNLLWFHNGEQFPRVVTKCFHEPDIPKQEFENLRLAHFSAATWVPKPLHCGTMDGYWTLWMQGVAATRFQVRDCYSPHIMQSMVETLGLIHRAMKDTKGRPDTDRHRRMVVEPLQAVARFGTSPSIREGCSRMAEKASVDWLSSQPVIPQHGDFVIANVLSHRREWYVIDWESFGVVDLPFYDLFTLLFSLLRVDEQTPDRWEAALVKQAPALIECYSTTTGLSSEDIGLLLPLALANWFHLQLADGRKEFAMRMYKAIHCYFEHTDMWEKVFLSSVGSSRN
jgi:hypothetical protein